MPRSALALALAALLSPAVAGAQQPPDGVQQQRTFCNQNVEVRVAPRDSVARAYRRYLGIWSDAAWDPRTCAALVVEDVARDGTASILYVYGPLGSDQPGPGGVLHGTGVIRNDELRFQNSDGTQFSFRPGIVDMNGRMTTPKGDSFEASFKKNL